MILFPVLLGMLLVTTLTLIGITATHVLAWRLHWFVRTAIILGALAPVLWVRAFEPFVIFVLEAATVAASVVIQRRLFRNAPASWLTPSTAGFVKAASDSAEALVTPPGNQLKFSVASLLLVITLVAGGLAIFQRMPRIDQPTWIAMIAVGLGSAGCVTLGRVAASGLFHWGLRWPMIAVVNGAIALLLARTDTFITAIFSEAISRFEQPELFWFAVCPSVSLVAGIWFATRSRRDSVICRVIRGVLLVGALIPAYACWSLLNPEPIPKREPLAENAFERIFATTQRIPIEKFENMNDQTVALRDGPFASLLDESRNELVALRPSLRLPSDALVNYTSMEAFSKKYEHHYRPSRASARIIAARGQLEMERGDPDEACLCFLDAVHLGFDIRAQGLIIDYLVGMACSGKGMVHLFEQRDQFTASGRRRAIVELLVLAESAEPYESFERRDRIWAQHTLGWVARLQLKLNDLSYSRSDVLASSRSDLLKREQAALRLLAVDFALRLYRADHGEFPELLEALVPDYLDHVPKDPFARQSEPLAYRRLDSEYVLYSVGRNQMDDGGHPRGDEIPNPLAPLSALDLSLNVLFSNL